MRRSAAPSLNARPLKRSKFSTPFRNVAQQCESSPSTGLTAKKENHSQEGREDSSQETKKVAISSSDSQDVPLVVSAPKYPTENKEKTCQQQPQASVIKKKFVAPTRTISSSEDRKDHLSNCTYMPGCQIYICSALFNGNSSHQYQNFTIVHIKCLTIHI